MQATDWELPTNVGRCIRNLVRQFPYLNHPVLHNNQKKNLIFQETKLLLSKCECLFLGYSLCQWRWQSYSVSQQSLLLFIGFVVTLHTTAKFIQTKVPLQEFYLCHMHHVISRGNRKKILCRIAAENNFCSLHYCFISSTSLWPQN